MMTSDVSCGRALHLVDNESCHLTPREPHDTTRKCLARRELTAFARSKDKDHSNRDSFRWHDVVGVRTSAGLSVSVHSAYAGSSGVFGTILREQGVRRDFRGLHRWAITLYLACEQRHCSISAGGRKSISLA
jgi:hypothetical protein